MNGAEGPIVRFTLQHPTDPSIRATYGWDYALGFWVEVRRRGRLLEARDALREAGGVTSVNTVIETMISHGFVTEEDIDQAMTWLPHGCPASIEDPAVRRAAEVVSNLRQNAAEG